MSEMPPEAPARPAGGGNVFTRKIGPLPMWAWLGIVGGVIVAYELFKSRAGASSSQSTPASDVPQFVNQTYVQGTPPVTPVPAPVPKPGKPPEPPSESSHRWVATGSESLSQIARKRHTTVAHLIAVTKASKISKENLQDFLAAAAHPARKLPKGTVYYTQN